MLTLIKMKWIVMLFLLLYTAGSYLHCAVLYGDILAQKYTIVLDFKDTPVEAVLDAITKQTGIKIAYNNEVLDRKKPVTVKIETSIFWKRYMPYWATAISVGRLMTISLFPNGQNRFRTRLPVNYQRWRKKKLPSSLAA